MGIFGRYFDCPSGVSLIHTCLCCLTYILHLCGMCCVQMRHVYVASGCLLDPFLSVVCGVHIRYVYVVHGFGLFIGSISKHFILCQTKHCPAVSVSLYTMFYITYICHYVQCFI